MIDIKSLDLEQVKALMKEWKEPEFRGKQLYQWIHQKLAGSFDAMSSLPLSLRERLQREAALTSLKVQKCLVSKLDGTRKYLMALGDGNIIESVMMPYAHGNSVCISSQVGCAMGCRFCASTLDGLVRNLTIGEMLDQVYQIQTLLSERISHVVMMGSGEPMDNYDNVVGFIKRISDKNGLHISQRNITVSTCGMVPAIESLAKEKLAVTLALSLHAPNDAVRREIMPIANRYGVEEVLLACDRYFKTTGRRVTYEYSLVAGVNDNPGEAAALSRLLKGRGGHVNLIPVNPIQERHYQQSSMDRIVVFKNILEKNGINVTIRREMGRDINGACGQLRRSYLETKKQEVGNARSSFD